MANCLTLTLLERPDWGEYQPLVEKLRRWPGYPGLVTALGTLKREVLFESSIHGPGHIERTMCHGAFCAMEEPLSPEDTRLLLLACSYHDIARENDAVDDLHGHRAALRIREVTGLTGEEEKLVQAAVDAHSRPDSQLEETVCAYAPADFSRGKRLAELLKDADGLDRVRIWDLDPAYLRREASRTRAGFAKKLYLRWQRETGQPAVPDFVRKWKKLDGNGLPEEG